MRAERNFAEGVIEVATMLVVVASTMNPASEALLGACIAMCGATALLVGRRGWLNWQAISNRANA